MSGTAAGDPSMEDILASIRRILDEDPAEPPPAPAALAAAAAEPAAAPAIELHSAQGDELLLDSSMLIDRPAPALPIAAPSPSSKAAEMAHPPSAFDAAEPAHEARAPRDAGTLLGSAAAEETAFSVQNLVRAVATDRTASVYRDGLTIEDVVREELRPLLKAWLDSHLPPLVERLVRSEIERVMNRAAP